MSGLPQPPLEVMKAEYCAPRFPSGRDVVRMVSGPASDVHVLDVLDVLKVAVTLMLDVRVTLQVPVPEHPPPLQPANIEPEDGVAVNVTTVPLENDLEQVDPQLMPEGELVTVPVPVPDLATCSVTELVEPVQKAREPFSGAVVGGSPPHADAKIDRTMIRERGPFLIAVLLSYAVDHQAPQRNNALRPNGRKCSHGGRRRPSGERYASVARFVSPFKRQASSPASAFLSSSRRRLRSFAAS